MKFHFTFYVLDPDKKTRIVSVDFNQAAEISVFNLRFVCLFETILSLSFLLYQPYLLPTCRSWLSVPDDCELKVYIDSIRTFQNVATDSDLGALIFFFYSVFLRKILLFLLLLLLFVLFYLLYAVAYIKNNCRFKVVKRRTKKLGTLGKNASKFFSQLTLKDDEDEDRSSKRDSTIEEERGPSRDEPFPFRSSNERTVRVATPKLGSLGKSASKFFSQLSLKEEFDDSEDNDSTYTSKRGMY